MNAQTHIIRRSYGEQIREGLEAEVAKGTLHHWDMDNDPVNGLRYTLVEQLTPSVFASSIPLSPGEVADWLNDRGHDVRIGRA